MVNPLTHPASGAVLGHALSQFPTALPGVHSSTHTPPSAVAAGFTVHSFTLSDRSMMGPHVYPASGAVPGLAFMSFPTAPSGYAFVPHSATVPGSAHVLVHAHLSQGHLT